MIGRLRLKALCHSVDIPEFIEENRLVKLEELDASCLFEVVWRFENEGRITMRETFEGWSLLDIDRVIPFIVKKRICHIEMDDRLV